MRLTELFEQKYTDKDVNGFGPIYDELFGPIRKDVEQILEIGVDRGGSIEAWLEYFPNATVFGVDLRPSGVHDNRYIEFVGNVTDMDFLLDSFGTANLDIVIDDGSHINREVIEAFTVLWPLVKPGGYYVVEDIQVPQSGRYYPTIGEWFETLATFDMSVKELVVPAYNMLWLKKDFYWQPPEEC